MAGGSAVDSFGPLFQARSATRNAGTAAVAAVAQAWLRRSRAGAAATRMRLAPSPASDPPIAGNAAVGAPLCRAGTGAPPEREGTLTNSAPRGPRGAGGRGPPPPRGA